MGKGRNTVLKTPWYFQWWASPSRQSRGFIGQSVRIGRQIHHCGCEKAGKMETCRNQDERCQTNLPSSQFCFNQICPLSRLLQWGPSELNWSGIFPWGWGRRREETADTKTVKSFTPISSRCLLNASLSGLRQSLVLKPMKMS